jgi:hypothetical protein
MINTHDQEATANINLCLAGFHVLLLQSRGFIGLVSQNKVLPMIEASGGHTNQKPVQVSFELPHSAAFTSALVGTLAS